MVAGGAPVPSATDGTTYAAIGSPWGLIAPRPFLSMTSTELLLSVNFTREALRKSYDDLRIRSKVDLDFFVLTISASIICAFGFNMNSASVIVGAMLLSPLLYPVICVGVATFLLDISTLVRSSTAFAAGVLLAIAVAAVVRSVLPSAPQSEIAERLLTNRVDYFVVAMVSGLAGTYAFFSPKIHEAVAGIAISVALIPPVIMLGIAVAQFDARFAIASGMIVICNVIGIYVGSIVTVAGLHLISRNSGKS